MEKSSSALNSLVSLVGFGSHLFAVFSASLIGLEARGAGYEKSDLYSLSLEDLLNIKVRVPAAITELAVAEVPASMTVIDAGAIERTPFRNTYDLIETYVPGALWVNHEEGPHLGIRGLIANRNYQYLLQVNGRNLNNKGFSGAKSELEMWDLGDVQRIEIVRGPGSVTYGPGAVAGVINIVTHKAESFEGSRLKTFYAGEYDSLGLSYTYGGSVGDKQLFFHASIVDTEGIRPDHFLVTRNDGAGFIGEDILVDSEPLDYFADAQNEPQIKAHFEYSLNDDWRLWARYTQQGSTWRGNEVKTHFGGALIDQHSMRDRQITIQLENESVLSDTLNLSARLGFDSYDVERRDERNNHPDPSHPLNLRKNFSEDEWYLNSILDWQPGPNIEVAFGFEYSHDKYGPGWGDNRDEMRLGEDNNIVSGPSSLAILDGNKGSAGRNGMAIFAGDGWSADTYSVFSEANFSLTEKTRLLLSAREDKHSFSEWLFSPRIAMVTTLSDGQLLKLIAQRSVRMNTAGQLFAEDFWGGETTTEKLDGFEAIYSIYREAFTFNASAYRNNIEVIGWEGDANESIPQGELQLWGIDLEFSYAFTRFEFGAILSAAEQIDWDLFDGLEGSGISYSDYNSMLADGILQVGEGNDLNNWANRSAKVFMDFEFNDSWLLHLNARRFWDFQGAKDGLSGLLKAHEGSPDLPAIKDLVEDLADRGVYGSDMRLNASLSYAPSDRVRLALFVHNLLGSNGNKRYSYDNGNDDPLPRRVRFIEEPRVIGASWEFRY